VLKKLYPLIPAIVAAVNGIAVAMTIVNQPGNYPLRLLAVQVAIVVVCLLLAFDNRFVRIVGFLLTFVGVFLTFSAMFLYIPTLLIAVWGVVRKRISLA
jgi:uncharacterized Tic20 family protein